MDKINYTEINSKTIDSWVEDGWEWGIPISREDYDNVGLLKEYIPSYLRQMNI